MKRFSFRLGCVLVAAFLLTAVFAPVLSTHDPAKIGPSYLPPSRDHFLGTNDIGQDIFSELLYGARVSIFIGIVSALIITVVGTVVGMICGYYGGKADRVFSACIDAALSLPALPLAFVIAAFFYSGTAGILLSICVTAWASTARLIRSKTMQLAAAPFVLASRAIGISGPMILLRHILPNLSSLVFTKGALSISSAMLMEASLSFLGLGTAMEKSWGKILYFALNRNGVINGYWWWYMPPILCIALCVMGFMLICYQGD